MPYTAPTLTQAIAALASRLNDPDNIHWTSAELTVYLREALRTWNAWTQQWRASDDFDTTLGQTFYDLGTVIPDLRGMTVTTWNLITDLQYALLEPPAAGGTWTGTEQFSLEQLTEAVQRRRDRFLRDTGCILTPSTVNYAGPAASGRIDLSESVMVVRRGNWRPTATQLLNPLMRTDEFAANTFAPGWVQSTDPPYAYSVSATPPLTLQLIPPTILAGDLELVSIDKGATIDPDVDAVLGVPDDFAWGVKFGALSDLLSNDGLALDSARAGYCDSRYQQAVDLAIRASVVIAARIDDVTCRISGLSDADAYDPLWSLVPGEPEDVIIAGQNLIATSPRAGGGGPFTILLDVVRNAPVPSVGGDILQVGQDVYDSILDYAQHLALFKEGPGQVELAMALLNKAMQSAGMTVNVQQASQPSRRPLLRQTQQDRQTSAEDLPVVPVE